MAEPTSHAARAARLLQETSDEILTEVQKLPSELITWIPAEGVWSVMDNLCHIREFVPFWTAEAVRIVRRPDESWGRDHTDAARLAAVADTAAYPIDEVAADIRREVRKAAETLRELTDADLAVEARSRNPRWDVKPASFVIDHLLVEHLEKHRGQILRNISQFGERRGRG
jgi:uncharacterized damage-inducible protein DinB